MLWYSGPKFLQIYLIFSFTHSMALAYTAHPPSARCITVMIYCVISSILYKFVMDDALESFSSEMMPNFFKT
jgi:hypothetical protein